MSCNSISLFTPSQLLQLLEIAKNAAAEAAALINECIDCRHTTLQIDTKANDADLVTQYDKRCEQIVQRVLQEGCAKWIGELDNNNNIEFDFLGEETGSGKEVTHLPTWIVDPIDGTTAFIHGGFDCGVSIGLVVDWQPVLGVVHLPRMCEVFTAARGCGAYLNGQRIYVSQCRTMNKALVSTHLSYNRSKSSVDSVVGLTHDLVVKHKVHGIRNYGSAAMDMCSVACGRLDLYLEAGIQAWDMCAGAIIVREAGGILCGLNTSDDVISGLEEYHQKQLGPIVKATYSVDTDNNIISDINNVLMMTRVETERSQFDIMNQSMVCGASAPLVAAALSLSKQYHYRECILYGKDVADDSKL